MAGLILRESRYLPRQKHPQHSHERATFCLVLQGQFTEIHRKASIPCTPATVLFYPAAESHAEQFHDDVTRCFIVEMEQSWMDRLRDTRVFRVAPLSVQGGKLSALMLALYRESRMNDDVSPLAVEGLALEIVSELSRSSQRSVNPIRSDRVAQATEIVRAKFRESATLDTVAKEVGLHPVYLARQFRKTHHCSVGTYVRRLRVEFACRELSISDASIAEISMEAGFFDQSHFTRIFKRFTRMTPAEYRAARLAG